MTMRWAAAFAAIAVTCSAAVYIHQREVFAGFSGSNSSATDIFDQGTPVYSHPSWEDPVAVLLVFGGLALAAGVVRFRR